MRTLLAIDVGTSSTKAAIYRSDGKCLAQSSLSYPVQVPRAGWAEQNPLDWWEAVCTCTRQVILAAGNHPIAGVGISGQAPSLVAVDANGTPLRPAVLWLDRRSDEQASWLREHLGLEGAISRTGNTLDSYYGGVKWLWFRQREPQRYQQTWKILGASSTIIFHLTGEIVMDYSQAGLSSPCFHLDQRCWDQDTCQLMGIDPDKLPRLVPSTEIVGQVSRPAAELTGIPVGTPVVAGGGDYALACLGAGGLKRGDAVAMLGTAGNLLVPDPAGSDPRLINTIHVTGGGLSLGGLTAGGLVHWLRDLLSLDETALFTAVEAEAAATPPGAEGLVFLPYLLGERTPVWDPNARGVFFGLTPIHRRGHLYRSVMEGVAFAFRQMLEIIRDHGTNIPAITLTDGGSSSHLWRQVFADVLGIPVHWAGRSGGTLLGAALLAGVGCGEVSGFETVRSWLGPLETHEPVVSCKTVYNQNYAVYSQLYDRLKELF